MGSTERGETIANWLESGGTCLFCFFLQRQRYQFDNPRMYCCLSLFLHLFIDPVSNYSWIGPYRTCRTASSSVQLPVLLYETFFCCFTIAKRANIFQPKTNILTTLTLKDLKRTKLLKKMLPEKQKLKISTWKTLILITFFYFDLKKPFWLEKKTKILTKNWLNLQSWLRTPKQMQN